MEKLEKFTLENVLADNRLGRGGEKINKYESISVFAAEDDLAYLEAEFEAGMEELRTLIASFPYSEDVTPLRKRIRQLRERLNRLKAKINRIKKKGA